MRLFLKNKRGQVLYFLKSEEVNVNKKENVRTRSIKKSVPKWLLELSPGLYSVMEICDLCHYDPTAKNSFQNYKYNYANIICRFNILEVEKIYFQDENSNKKIMKYDWKGAQFYIDKFFEINSQKKPIHNKISDWMKELQKGDYSIREICQRFNLNYSHVYFKFSQLNLTPILVKENETFIRKYQWPGESFYEKK